jgi:hypothetical protein
MSGHARLTAQQGIDLVASGAVSAEVVDKLQADLVYVVNGGTAGAPASATESTLQAIENLLKGDRAPTETIWTDSSNSYFLRVRTYNQETNLWEAPTYTLPSGGAYTPVAGLRPASGTADRELKTDQYTANKTATGYTIGDRISKTTVYDLLLAIPSIAATFWVNEEAQTQLASAPPIADLAPPTTPATGRVQVIYRLNNGDIKTGYVGQLAPNPTLFADLIGTIPVTIGVAPTEANIATIEPARSVLSSSQSFPIAHAAAIIDPFVQPSIGSQVSITANNKSAIGTMPQFAVGSSVFLADTNGVQIGGHYIIRSNSYPTFSVELQNPAANELGAGQIAIAPGASTPALEMIAMSRLIPPVGVTHATLSVTRPNGAVVSAISGANSSIDTVLQQSQKDQAQVNYPAVALNFAPASLGWDAGPKTWVQDSIALSKEELSCWLHAWADEGRTVYATVRWFGGVK